MNKRSYGLGLIMTIFSSNYIKLIYSLDLNNKNYLEFNWKTLYLNDFFRFYRPINLYNFFYFIYTKLLTYVNKYFYLIINKPTYYIVYLNFLYLEEFSFFLKNNLLLGYNYLSDIVVVDYPSRESRFELVYNLVMIDSVISFFMKTNKGYNFLALKSSRILVKTHLSEFETISSLSNLYKSASWLERKAWDFFGILFSGNKNIRRIFTDYGFSGHPMRKDFPLSGYYEVRYDDLTKIICIEPVEVSQEMRFYNFLNPWESLYLDKVKY